MVCFSQDRDILKYEPAFFTDNHFANQVVADGSGGVLSGTTFIKAGEDFQAKAVEAGDVIYLNDAAVGLDGAYEIVSVDSATQLTVSVIRHDTEADAIAPPISSSSTAYRICTYKVQAGEVAYELTQYFGLKPGSPASDYDADDLLDADVLKQMSTYAVLGCLYASIADSVPNENNCWQKSYYYKKLFERTRSRCKVDIDLGQDGIIDLSRLVSSPKVVRS